MTEGVNAWLKTIADAIASSDSDFATALGTLFRSTSTRSQVASSVSSETILASNTSRKGASICNTDANALYLVMGAVAATTANADYVLATGQTLNVPFGYTGEIRGIWAADGSGAANVVEYA